jgi:hypothetical protein
VVTRKIFKKVAGTMFPKKIVEISAFPLRKPQLIRRGEQKISAIFLRLLPRRVLWRQKSLEFRVHADRNG